MYEVDFKSTLSLRTSRLRGECGSVELGLLDMKLVDELLLRLSFDRCLNLNIGL
jgi:hypothetical protein